MRKPAWINGQFLSALDLEALTDFASPRLPIAFAEGASAVAEIAESEPIVKLSARGTGEQDLIIPRGRFFVGGRYVDTTDLAEDQRRTRLERIPDGVSIDAFLTFKLELTDVPSGAKTSSSKKPTRTGTLAYQEVPKVTLVGTGAPPPGALLLARFTREAGAPLIPVENFVPPCIWLDSLPELRGKLARKFSWLTEPAYQAASLLRNTDAHFSPREWRLEAVVRFSELIQSALALHGARLSDVYRLLAIAANGARRTLTEEQVNEDIPYGAADILMGHTLNDVFEFGDLQEAVKSLVQIPIVADDLILTVPPVSITMRRAGNLTSFSTKLEFRLRKIFPTEKMLTITLQFANGVLNDDTWASCHPELGPNALGPPYNQLKLRKISDVRYVFELPFGDNETADAIGGTLNFKVTISEIYDGPKPTISIGSSK